MLLRYKDKKTDHHFLPRVYILLDEGGYMTQMKKYDIIRRRREGDP